MKLYILIVLFNAMLLSNPFQLADLQAQTNHRNHTKTGKLRIDSSPVGAYVEISGKYSFVGRTPFVLPYTLVGKYTISARKEGYENVKATVNLASRGANQITLRLFKKTRFKASYRSLLLPGWGQFYGQGKFKGFFVLLSQATLGSMTWLAYKDYRQARDEYNQAVVDFEKVRFDLTKAEAAFAIVQKEFREAQDKRDRQKTFTYITLGFWAYNFLDSILFFSPVKQHRSDAVRQRPYFSGQISKNTFKFSMNFGF